MKQSSRLLIDESPLQVLPSLAVAIGLNEAIFLQQLQYWLKMSKHEHDGRKWVYNSTSEWAKQFPFWSESTLKRIVAELRERELILTRNDLNARPMDKTLWYAIDYEVLDSIKLTPSSYQVDTMVVSTCTDGEGQVDTTNTIRLQQEITTEKTTEIVPSGTPPPNEPVAKEKKRRRKKAEADSPPSSGDPPSPKEPTDWQKFVGAMCWICFGHDKVSDLTSAQRGALLAEAKKINEAGYSIEDLKKWYLDTWKQGWKWKKDESRPTPAEVRSSIPVLRSNAPEGFDGRGEGNGQAASGTGFSPEEIERIRELRREGKREEVGEYVRAINARSGANL